MVQQAAWKCMLRFHESENNSIRMERMLKEQASSHVQSWMVSVVIFFYTLESCAHFSWRAFFLLRLALWMMLPNYCCATTFPIPCEIELTHLFGPEIAALRSDYSPSGYSCGKKNAALV
jgi:hypothetical protein